MKKNSTCAYPGKKISPASLKNSTDGFCAFFQLLNIGSTYLRTIILGSWHCLDMDKRILTCIFRVKGLKKSEGNKLRTRSLLLFFTFT